LYGRARQDLTERCVYWLKTLLKYKRPPGRVLELGAAYGAFVGLLKLAGFDPIGLDLSPWVVNFAHQTFDVPMLTGRIEKQNLESESFDVIVMMDVLEHLPNPVETLSECMRLLKPDGILMIQTPEYKELSYSQLQEKQDDFLTLLLPKEHIFLFSQRGVKLLFERLDNAKITFEKNLFSYDMFFVAAKSLEQINDIDEQPVLDGTPAARLVQALIDKYDEAEALKFEVRRYHEGNEQLHSIIDSLEGLSRERLQTIEQLEQVIQNLQHNTSQHIQFIEQQQAAIENLQVGNYDELELRSQEQRSVSRKEQGTKGSKRGSFVTRLKRIFHTSTE
jgi:SAM-dependent methyltransferase